MTMNQRIDEIKRLIDEQLASVPDNPIEEQYKSRIIMNYATALKALMDIERAERREE